jgi:hypothetical protein
MKGEEKLMVMRMKTKTETETKAMMTRWVLEQIDVGADERQVMGGMLMGEELEVCRRDGGGGGGL